MSSQLRLIVGGLPRGIEAGVLLSLVAPCGESCFHLVDAPGAADEVMAIVHLGHNASLGERLRVRIERQRVGGHRLWAWVTAMPWA